MTVRPSIEGLPRYEAAKLRLFLTAGSEVTVTVATRRPAAADVRLSALAAAVADVASMRRVGPVVAVFTPGRGGDGAGVREPRRPTPPREIGRHAAPVPVPCRA